MNFSELSTDILHEYFIPFDRFHDFTKALSKTVREHGADLLNVTVRDIKKDDDAYMRYAHGDRLALVLLFTQERTVDGERKMQTMTRELIDEALNLGGNYYLPYRLHATDRQMKTAYPMAADFFKLKKKHDPNELFQNQFYVRYS
jgi:FAD/FMN-containing dehydrogenase